MSHTNKNLYRGPYSVGCFEITNDFILNYMSVIYGVNIKDDDVQLISDEFMLSEKKIVYMQMSDILNKRILKEIREVVKNPPEYFEILRQGNNLLSIECLKQH